MIVFVLIRRNSKHSHIPYTLLGIELKLGQKKGSYLDTQHVLKACGFCCCDINHFF